MTADSDDDNDGVLDTADAFPLHATESVDIDADGIGDNIDLDTSGDGIYDDRHFDPLDLQNLFLSRERITSTTDDYLAIGQGVQHNEVLYRLPVADAGIFLPNGLFSVAIEMFEQRNFGSSDKDFLTGISDGTNVILFTNNDSSNGGAWIGQDSGQTITEANRVSFWGNFEHYLVLFEFSDGQARLTVEVMSGEDAGYIESKIVGSVGQIDLSSKLELVLVGNSADEDYRLEGVSIIYPDRDFDGFPNVNDAFPLDAAESIDTDSDGTGNNADTDDDGDGVPDTADGYALISLGALLDTDSDGFPNECDEDCLATGMTADSDDDNDGVEDTSDAFPLDASETADSDSDGVGDNSDAFPNDATESLDSDSDSVGDNADNCPSLSNSDQLNTDGDTEGDACDSDDDNDGFSDEEELTDGTDPLSRFSCKSGCFSFDVDENLEAQPLTDGLLVIRHLFGFSGDSLTSGAVSSEASRVSSEAIAGYLTGANSELDIDGDGESKPLTDGLLLIRYLFGFSGDSLISGAIGSGAERDTAEKVEGYIKERLPQ